MNIIDSFISKARKIDPYQQFEIVDTIDKHMWKEYVSSILDKGEIAIILDESGFYKDEINSMNGLFVEVQSVGIGSIHVEFPNKPDDEYISLEDFRFIGIGFKGNFAQNNIRKQSMALGSSLLDFFLVDSKTININKYIFVGNNGVLTHWGLKSRIGIMQARNFKCVLVKE